MPIFEPNEAKFTFRCCIKSSPFSQISTFGTMAHYSAEIQGSSDMFSHFQVRQSRSFETDTYLVVNMDRKINSYVHGCNFVKPL